MIIKNSDELNLLAKAAGKSTKELSSIIVSELIMRDMIQDTADYWGCKLFDCIEKTTPVSDVVDILQSAGIGIVKSEHWDKMMDLVLVGTGNCPICGGDMEVIDADYKCCGGDGYITEREYVPVWEQKKCSNCGYTD